MLLQNSCQPIMVGFACLCLQFFRTDFPTEPLNFVKYFASFFRRNKTKIRCNYWENVKFSKVEQTKLGSNHWFSNTYLRLILMIAYAKIIAFVSVEIFTLFFFFSKIQQNVLRCTANFVIAQKDCEKIQAFFCNYFSMCTLFWNWSGKKREKLLI